MGGEEQGEEGETMEVVKRRKGVRANACAWPEWGNRNGKLGKEIWQKSKWEGMNRKRKESEIEQGEGGRSGGK